MNELQYLSLKGYLDKYTLDDDIKFWLELDQVIELNPIREYKNIIIEEPYEHTVKLDLDTRTSSLINLIKKSKYNKRLNANYLCSMAIRLQEKASKVDRLDLVQLLEHTLQEITL
jgi:hypothetical protein